MNSGGAMWLDATRMEFIKIPLLCRSLSTLVLFGFCRLCFGSTRDHGHFLYPAFLKLDEWLFGSGPDNCTSLLLRFCIPTLGCKKQMNTSKTWNFYGTCDKLICSSCVSYRKGRHNCIHLKGCILVYLHDFLRHHA